MSLIETLEKHAAEIYSKIVGCRRLEQEHINEINSISADDVRGQTPVVSERIRQLDAQRRNLAATRRHLTGELATAQATLDKAKQITKKR